MFQIEADYVERGRAGRVGLDIFPMKPRNAPKVRWAQRDNFFGMQQLRGLDGAPVHVNRVGMRTYEYEPGVFGEYTDITETELTIRAGSIDINAAPIGVGDLVTESTEFLVGRELDRMENSAWSILTTGVISILLDDVDRGTQVGYSDSFSIQTFTAANSWANFANSTPIKDMQAVQQLSVGRALDFGASSNIWVNQVTANNLLNNANANDFGGRRTQYGATLNSLTDFNNYFGSQNLPKISVYDQGFYPRKPTVGSIAGFRKFIPNNIGVLVGKRTTGETIGEYQLTRNASAGFRPGSYQYMIDRANGVLGEKRTPANIEIHRGHNGGPAIYFPSAIVLMNI
jgi:hypothetical protein